jgi:hypothetical protein
MSRDNKEVIDLSNSDMSGWNLEQDQVTLVNEGGTIFLRNRTDAGVVVVKHVPGLSTGKRYDFSLAVRADIATLMGVVVRLGWGGKGQHLGLNIEIPKADVSPGNWILVSGQVHKKVDTETDVVWIHVYAAGVSAVDMGDMTLSLTPAAP